MCRAESSKVHAGSAPEGAPTGRYSNLEPMRLNLYSFAGFASGWSGLTLSLFLPSESTASATKAGWSCANSTRMKGDWYCRLRLGSFAGTSATTKSTGISATTLLSIGCPTGGEFIAGGILSRFADVLVRSGRKGDRGRIFRFGGECAHSTRRSDSQDCFRTVWD